MKKFVFASIKINSIVLKAYFGETQAKKVLGYW